MSRIAIVLLCLLVVPALAEPLRILPLGDSITQADARHYSYRYRLWKKLVDHGVDFDFVGSLKTNHQGIPAWPPYQGRTFDPDHEGHWRWRTDQINQRLEEWCEAYTADVVLLHLGSNDILQNQDATSTLEDLEVTIDLLRRDNPDVVILLAKLIPVNRREVAGIIALNRRMDAFVKRMHRDHSPVQVVDQHEGFSAFDDLYDEVQPNELGEEKMAARWMAALYPPSATSTHVDGGLRNGSFEARQLVNGFQVPAPVAGWRSSGGVVLYNPHYRFYASSAPAGMDGRNMLSLNGSQAWIEQALRGPDGIPGNGDDPMLLPTHSYTLHLSLGRRLEGRFGGCRIQLLAGSSVVASEQVAVLNHAAGTFSPVVLHGNTGPGHPGLGSGIRIRIERMEGPETYLDIDAVALSSQRVP